MPVEKVMRGAMNPDMVCMYESMRSAIARLEKIGITKPAMMRPADIARIPWAVECMPQEPEVIKAASTIEEELQVRNATGRIGFAQLALCDCHF